MAERVTAIRTALRGRMRFYKLRASPQGSQQAASYNENVQVQNIPDHNDPYRIDWLEMEKEEDVIIGNKVQCNWSTLQL
jgi:actin-related protein 8